jgi:hypothetical protein
VAPRPKSTRVGERVVDRGIVGVLKVAQAFPLVVRPTHSLLVISAKLDAEVDRMLTTCMFLD